MRRLLCACALGASFLGCDVATVKQAPSTIAQNSCQSASDCGAGECVDNQCRTRQGTLGVALIEVTPPASASDSAGLQFLLPKVALPPAGGELPLALDAVSRVSFQVILTGRNCRPVFVNNGIVAAIDANSTMPTILASVTITPSQRSLGISTPPVIAQTSLIHGSYYGFSANLPAGTYDIYVQPLPHDSSCIVPPQLRRGQRFEGGSTNVALPLPEPSVFELHVSWPKGDGALAGWTVDMLDSVSGHVISNSAPLAVSNGQLTDYVARISYLPVVGGATDSNDQELLRLSPPEGITAPTILLARSALGLFNPNRGTLSQFSALPPYVHVQGQVNAMVTPQPAAATLTLVATEVTGIEPGVIASFVRTVRAGDDGQFDLDLLPGTYRVSAVPGSALNSPDLLNQPGAGAPLNADTPLSEVTTEWKVPPAPLQQAGKVIQLNRALAINGQALDTRGVSEATALVQAVASSAFLQRDALREALHETTLVPRASTGTVEGGGDFKLLADSGTFDLSVRPQASTGFAWSVVPAVPVGTTPETSNGTNLTLVTPLPVQYSGTVTVPGATVTAKVAVPGALIRAYVYTTAGSYTSDPNKADSVVQVAETRADDAGRFTLLIPASLNTSAQ